MEQLAATKCVPKLPPTPAGLPFIGHFHLLSKLPHISLQQLSKEHGPLMHLRLGSVPLIVASSPSTAKEFLKTHDEAFAYRPANNAVNIILQLKTMSYSPYGEYWKMLRRLCGVELFAAKKVSSGAHITRDELWELSRNLVKASEAGELVGVRSHLRALGFNVMTRILMKKTYFGSKAAVDPETEKEAKTFIDVIDEVLVLGASFSISDYFPHLSWLDWNAPRCRVVAAKVDGFLQKILDEHRDGDGLADFVETARSYLVGDPEESIKIKALLVDLIIGGSETSSIVVEWALAELLHHPEWIAKAQKEIEDVVGRNRMVEESDLPKLQLLDAIIKETFRLHPPLALLVPHASIGPQTVSGYDIPANAMLMVNVYAIGRDPQVWRDPLEFKPERFIGSNICVHGQNFELLPFGSGRRGCPGLPLGLMNVQLVLSNLLHGFDWNFSGNPQDQPMNEVMGIVTSMANTLKARVRPRLKDTVYMTLIKRS